MLSRVAEQLYWMARYMERAENTARLVTVHGNLLLDLPRAIRLGWEPLIEITGNHDLFKEHHRGFSEQTVVSFLLQEEANPSSVLSCLTQARENTRISRDILPREAWEHINDLYLMARRNAAGAIARRGRHRFVWDVINGCQQVTGMLAGTMSHDAAYDFIRIGRNLERGDMTSRLLDVRSANLLKRDDLELAPFDNAQWMSVLKSVSGYQMYRRQVRLRIRAEDVLAFLLQSEQFPRAVYHCLKTMEGCLSNLPANAGPLRSLTTLQRHMREADVPLLANVPQDLHRFIDELQLGLGRVHNQIAGQYFHYEIGAASQQQAAG